MLLQSEIPYLALGSMLSHPDTNLVSSEGSFFRLNSSVLASASEWLKGLFSECQSQDEKTIFTNISEHYLSLLCQYVCTGMILVKPEEYEDVMSAFSSMSIDMKDIVIENENASICKVFEEQRRMIYIISCNDETKPLKQSDKETLSQSVSEEPMDAEFGASNVGSDCLQGKVLEVITIDDNIEQLPDSRNKVKEIGNEQVGESSITQLASEDTMNIGLNGPTVEIRNLLDPEVGRKTGQPEKQCANHPISQSESAEMVDTEYDGRNIETDHPTDQQEIGATMIAENLHDTQNMDCDEMSKKWNKQKKSVEPRINTPGGMKVRQRQLKYLDENSWHCESPDTYFHFPQDGERNTARFQCTLCTRGFRCENQFFQHVKRHDAKGFEEAWACDQCDARLPSVPGLVKHRITRHSESYGECHRCKMAIPMDKFLVHTKRKKCIDVQLQCVFCGMKLNYLKEREKHERTYNHTNKCASCDMELGTFSEHQFHVLLKHDGKFRVKCSICSQVFENNLERRNHTRIVHSKTPALITRENENIKSDSKVIKSTVDHQTKSPLSGAQRKVPDRALADAQNFLAQNLHDNSLVCPKCSKKLRNKKSFDAHVANHENMEKVDIQIDQVAEDLWNENDNDSPFQPMEKVGGPERPKAKRPNDFSSKNPILQSLESVQPAKILKCNKCPKTFSAINAGYSKAKECSWRFRQHFLQHEESFDPAKPWSCYLCPEKFVTAKLWTDHEMAIHFKLKDVKEIVQEDQGLEYFKIRKRSKPDKKSSTTCPFCEQEFLDVRGQEKSIYLHIETEHKGKLPKSKTTLEEKLYECTCCGKRFDLLYSFKAHLQNSGPYHDDKCPLCPGVKFKSWSEHKSHVSEFHNGNFVNRCKLCPEVFDNQIVLKVHVRDLHQIRSKKPCAQCGKSVVDLDSHMKLCHEKRGAFACDKCEEVFTSTGTLKVHKIAKHNHRPLPICDLCGKEMPPGKSLERHMLYHHTKPEDKPFKCTICIPVKGFAMKSRLDEHMNTHTGEKPFKCKLCQGVAYANKANLAAHIRSFHKGIKRVKKRDLSHREDGGK